MSRFMRQAAGYEPWRSPYPNLAVGVPMRQKDRDLYIMRHSGRTYDVDSTLHEIERGGNFGSMNLDDFGLDDMDDEEWMDAVLGADPTADSTAVAKPRVRPFEAISRMFSKAQQASEKADATVRAAQQMMQAPPPQIVTREVQKFTGTEAAITAGIALGAFGLGWLAHGLVQKNR